MDKKFVFSNILITTSLLFVIFFHTEGVVQQILTSVTFLFLLPLLFTRFILKTPLKKLSLSFPEKLTDILFACIVYIIVGGILITLSSIFSLSQPPVIIESFALFFLLHILFTGIVTFVFEFFFRGFVQTTWREKIGKWSILLQWLIFIFFLVATNSLKDTDMLPFIILAPISGIISHKTNSIVITFLFSWIFVILYYSIGVFLN